MQERNAFAVAHSMSPMLNAELDHDRRYHPNLGGVTRGGLANHYPMTLLALHGLGASDDEVHAFRRTWPRHRALISDLNLVDRRQVTADNWPEFLGRSECLAEFRRVFEDLLSGSPGLDAVLRALGTMQRGLPMGLFHPLIRLSFAVQHGDRGLIADALAYMAIRHVDLYGSAALPAFARVAPSCSAATVWQRFEQTSDVSRLVRSIGGASIHICEHLSAEQAVQRGALPPDFDLSAAALRSRMPEIAALALRLYLFAPSLTTLHAVTTAQALADLTLRSGLADPDALPDPILASLWARYWIWLTALFIEKGQPTRLPVLDTPLTPSDDAWPALAARARAIPEVHLIKMAYSCCWLEQTFGPEPLYKLAVVNMLRERRAHPTRGASLAQAAI